MIYSRSPGWQSPQEQKNVSPAPYPWRKLYSCKNKTFLGPTFPFPWSSGLSSLAALGRQLSCRSRKVKSCPSESLVLTWIHSFRGKERGIYIPNSTELETCYYGSNSISLERNIHSWFPKPRLYYTDFKEVSKLELCLPQEKLNPHHPWEKW